MIRKVMRLFAALALAALVPFGASALQQDQTRNFPPRLFTTQQTHYWRVLVNFSDPNISTAQKFGAIPLGSVITSVKVEVVTAFNAATTNVLTIGTSTSANEIVASGDVLATSTGVTEVTRGYGSSLAASADTTLFAKYTQSGTAATTGAARIIIEYIPPGTGS